MVNAGNNKATDQEMERLLDLSTDPEFLSQLDSFKENKAVEIKAEYKDKITALENEIQNIPNYNGKILEYFQVWECEGFLRECINRNKLSKYHLISPKTYIKLLEYIKQHQIHDCSHKNIMIEGICHYQNTKQNKTNKTIKQTTKILN